MVNLLLPRRCPDCGWACPRRRGVINGFLRAVLLLAGLILPLRLDSAQSPRVAEYEIKAAFLYKLIRFTEWPAAEPKMTGETFVIGVLGADPFGSILDQMLEEELIDQKKVVAKRFTRVEDATDSHIVFIGSSTPPDLPRILKTLESHSVLSVSDIDNFARRGGIIALKNESNRIIFEINIDAAKRAKLTLSSQLLGLARIVREES
jgi:hypothetical protein